MLSVISSRESYGIGIALEHSLSCWAKIAKGNRRSFAPLRMTFQCAADFACTIGSPGIKSRTR